MSRVAIVAALAGMVVACFGAGSVLPTANLAECVAADAFAGKSVAQIAIDCSSDVEAVLASLLATKDPKVQTTPAFTEARQTKAALSRGEP